MNTKRIRGIAMLAVAAVAMSSSLLYADFSGNKSCESGKAVSGKTGYNKKEAFKDFNLTDEQKKMLEANRSKHREDMKALFNDMKTQKAAMSQELQKQTLDMAKINQINGELKKLEARMLDYKLQGILDVRNILSPEQFKKFSEKMEERKGHDKAKKN